jgi:hypothetical protein
MQEYQKEIFIPEQQPHKLRQREDIHRTAYFFYRQYTLGTVHAESDYTGGNFDLAGAWIK